VINFVLVLTLIPFNNMDLIFASNNKNKIIEIQSMLPEHIKIKSLEDINCHEEIPETANTIEGNAILKANYITQKYGYNCFADDTGLEVESLDGAPGVFSARYAGEHKNSNDNMDKLLMELKDKSNRKAQFKTVICLNLDGKQHLFTGTCAGDIVFEKKGNQGFGYDPIFKPIGFDVTFAEISLTEKAQISHRGIATKKLIEYLEGI
jgi:XTP/dITP diphosphohydrolase